MAKKDYKKYSDDFITDMSSISVLIGNNSILCETLIEKIFQLEKRRDYSLYDLDALYKFKFLLEEIKRHNLRILEEIKNIL